MGVFFSTYTRHTSNCMCVGCTTRPTYVDLAPQGPLQAAFKPASGRFVSHPNTYLCKLIGMTMRDILPLTEGQPLAGQIVPDEFGLLLPRDSALWPPPFGVSASAVQNVNVLS